MKSINTVNDHYFLFSGANYLMLFKSFVSSPGPVPKAFISKRIEKGPIKISWLNKQTNIYGTQSFKSLQKKVQNHARKAISKSKSDPQSINSHTKFEILKEKLN